MRCVIAVVFLVVGCASCATSPYEFRCDEFSDTRYPRTRIDDVVFVEPASYIVNQWVGCELLELASIRMRWPVDGTKDSVPSELIARCRKIAASLGGDAAVLFMIVGTCDVINGTADRDYANGTVKVVRSLDRECQPMVAYIESGGMWWVMPQRPYEAIGDLGTRSNDDYTQGADWYDEMCGAFVDSARTVGGDAILVRIGTEETSGTAIRYLDRATR